MYDTKDERYWSESHYGAEVKRIVDVCHGCRLCFNVCPSFVNLFETIDSRDENPDNLNRQDYDRVTDYCYECRLCYLRCPYTPPHDFNLDFPRLMLRGKALNAKRKGISLRDRLTGNTDLLGNLGKYTAPLANFSNDLAPVRFLMEKTVGIARHAKLPRYHWQTFRDWFRGRRSAAPANPAGKVAIFYTCLVNYNAPHEGKAMVRVLEHNQVEMAAPKQRCCGMPYLDGGNVDAARSNARTNVEALAKLVRQGYDIVTPEATCAYVLKQEYPLLLDGEDVDLVAKNTYDISEYLIKFSREGKLNKEFVGNPGKITYHASCYTRAQQMGLRARDLLQLIPGVEVTVVERCSGHDGSWGVKAEYYETSMKIGERLFKEVEEEGPATVMSDCSLAGNRIQEGTGQQARHPIEILAEAYGLKE